MAGIKKIEERDVPQRIENGSKNQAQRLSFFSPDCHSDGRYYFALHSNKRKKVIANVGSESQAVIIHAAVATEGDIGVYIDVLGTVTPISTVNIYSQVSGRVVTVHYREGQTVHRGDALIEIDPRPYEAQLQQAEGLLDHDRGVLKQAEIDLTRYKEAFVEHAVAKKSLTTRNRP
jgi:membrane fusion protein, multidrug efflux system